MTVISPFYTAAWLVEFQASEHNRSMLDHVWPGEHAQRITQINLEILEHSQGAASQWIHAQSKAESAAQ